MAQGASVSQGLWWLPPHENKYSGPSISASLPPRRRVNTESTGATINNQKLTAKPSAASGASLARLSMLAHGQTVQEEGVDSSFFLLANSLSVSPLDVTNGTQLLVSFDGLWACDHMDKIMYI